MTDPSTGHTKGTQRPDTVSTKQARIAELAKSQPEMAFTALNASIWIGSVRPTTEPGRIVHRE
jgi:hypothetical protein